MWKGVIVYFLKPENSEYWQNVQHASCTRNVQHTTNTENIKFVFVDPAESSPSDVGIQGGEITLEECFSNLKI